MTTRVLVTSDTHLTTGARLPASLLALAERADHIVHAGDLVDLDVLAVLEAFAPVTAVVGNVDDAAVAARLLERAEVELDGVHIGVLHIPGPTSGRDERLRGWFPRSDVIVYGHTHLPDVRFSDVAGAQIINPGSPVQRRRAPFHSAVWMELSEGRISVVELVDLDQA